MEHQEGSGKISIHMPSPTAWPITLALGLTLIVTGFVTSLAISLLGLILLIVSSIGWFRDVLPVEKHFEIEAAYDPSEVARVHEPAAVLPVDSMHRKIVPVETFQITTGLRGGIAGGLAMIIPAAVFSMLKFHSLWYAMNLLAAGGFVSWANQSNAFLGEFHLKGLLAALAIHIVSSLLVGLLYGAMLPMFPRWPVLTAGFIAPLLWTGLIYSTLGVVSPILNQRIDWLWFVPSQIAFGLVAGYVVNRHEKVRTPQFRALPFAIRAGLHMDDRRKVGTPQTFTPPTNTKDSGSDE
ncbi:MAG TPA: hypothetical protein VHZ52_03785 [Acidobacteriaceae bacterium]|jgi:hypothetical protein|nr:hypothetical protein [Acidobacteriaceae bacterium]